MYRCCTNPHFSVRNSGTIRQRCGVLPHRPVTIVTGHLPLLRGGIKVPIKLPCVKGNRFGLQPPLRKGEVLHPLEDEAEGYTPRLRRGVYCHCCDSTSEVNDTPKVMKRRGESLISPAPDRGGRRRAAAAPGPGCRLPATAKTAGGGRAVRGCPRGWKPADKHRY